MLNAIKYSEELEKAGFSKEQANKSVKVWLELMDQNFATRSDLKEFQLTMEVRFAEHKAEMKSDLSKFKDEIKADIGDLRADFNDLKAEFSDLKADNKNLESRMTIKLGLMQAASVAILSTIILLAK